MVEARPRSTLRARDAVSIIVGIVVGAGIFKTPSLVAGASGSETLFLLAWLAGGAASFIGALCYAELASTYPSSGGDYHFLLRAFGRPPAFMFGWARLSVIQTGSIALLAYLIGDYLTELADLGAHSSPIWAGVSILALTGLNCLGIRPGSRTQHVFTLVTMAGLAAVAASGLLTTPAPRPVLPEAGLPQGFGSAMIFVLLTFGGWNEGAYLSAELRDPGRNMMRVLVASLGIVTGVYLALNLVFLRGLGLGGMSGSSAVAADLMRQGLGESGAGLVSLFIALAAASTMNGSIITGARSSYALGRDFPILGFLGHWTEDGDTPRRAVLFQGGAALALVGLGAVSRSGFSTMVDYTAPVFWLFFLLTGLSLFRLRQIDKGANRPFQVPLYPLIPAAFCLICAYMLHASLAFTGFGAVMGLAVLAAGLPLLIMNRAIAADRPAARRNSAQEGALAPTPTKTTTYKE